MTDLLQTTGEPMTTLKHTVANTVETLVDDVTGFVAQTTKTVGADSIKRKINVVGCLITVEDNSIRFSFGANATNDAGTGLGHVLTAGQSLKLTNHKQIIDLRFINKVSASVAVLQITPELSIK